MHLVIVSRGIPVHVQAVRLCTISTELLGQWPVTVRERGHQVSSMLHLDLIGTRVDRHASGVRGQALPCHSCPLQKVVAEHISGLLHLDGDWLRLRLLRHAHACQCHVRGRGTVTRLLEDRTVGRQPLELGLRGCTMSL